MRCPPWQEKGKEEREMSKQYETVIGLEVHVERHENKNILRLLYGIRRGAKYPHLSGMHRYARLPSGP